MDDLNVLFSYFVSARLPLVLCIRLLKKSSRSMCPLILWWMAYPNRVFSTCLYDVLTFFLLYHCLTETCEIVVVGLAD